MRKLIARSFILLILAVMGSARLFPTTTEEFLLTPMAQQRNAPETAYQLLAYISNQMVSQPENDEAVWLHAAMLYFIADYYITNFQVKKEIFTMVKNYSFKAVSMNSNSADSHYWLAIGYAKWSEANGILDSLFNVGNVLNELTRTLELRPGFYYGVGFAIRAKVYDLAPGWPLSYGNKEQALKDIQSAFKFGPDFRFNYQLYTEILMNNGRFEEAKRQIEMGLALPYDKKYPREEDKIIAELKKDLVIVNSRLNRE